MHTETVSERQRLRGHQSIWAISQGLRQSRVEVPQHKTSLKLKRLGQVYYRFKNMPKDEKLYTSYLCPGRYLDLAKSHYIQIIWNQIAVVWKLQNSYSLEIFHAVYYRAVGLVKDKHPRRLKTSQRTLVSCDVGRKTLDVYYKYYDNSHSGKKIQPETVVPRASQKRCLDV